ncbi:hypothetical protein IJ843_05610 [bacterium]|nr:hypothetical protein [bacterium]
MGIIGVVAALTLPNLNSSTGEKEKVAKVKKIYSNLQDAFGRAEAVYGPYNEWFVNDTKRSDEVQRLGERIAEFMKISKICGTDGTAGCVTSGKTNFIGSGGLQLSMDLSTLSNTYSYITTDGTTILFYINNSDIANIYVDIDGPNKGSFTMGKDLFSFTIDDEDEGIQTMGSSSGVLYQDSVLIG